MDVFELKPELIANARQQFRYHRPVIEWFPTDIGGDPNYGEYHPYTAELAACDSLYSAGLSFEEEFKNFQLKNELVKAVHRGVKNWRQITERRQEKAQLLNHKD
jgi:hypothetical protein